MYYLIYEIKNKLNGKIYIGYHKTKNLNDGYMGSGKYIKRAIAKHGIENFAKRILFHCDSEEEMKQKEVELVTEEFVLQNTNYNLKKGGQGGFRSGFVSIKGKQISKEVFDNDPELVGVTKGQNNQKTSYVILDNDNKVRYVIENENFIGFCKKHNLPYGALGKSLKDQKGIYSKLGSNAKRIEKAGLLKYKGWYAKRTK